MEVNNRTYDQQQTGESTSSSNASSSDNRHQDDHGNVDEKRESQRIIRTMVNFMTILADMPDSPLPIGHRDYSRREQAGRENGVSEQKAGRRRRRTGSISPYRRNSPSSITTPEREIPSSSQETTETSRLLRLPRLSSTAAAETGLQPEISSPTDAPSLIAISPDTDLFGFDDRDDDDNFDVASRHFHHHLQTTHDSTIDSFMTQEERFCRSRLWAKQKLAEVIFSHPGSLRSFCVEAHRHATARQQRKEEDKERDDGDFNAIDDTEGVTFLVTRRVNAYEERSSSKRNIPRGIFSIPLSITVDTWTVTQEMTLDVSFATLRITLMALDASVCIVVNVWDGVTRLNPLHFVYKMITRPFNMMGKTTEVVVSGIQSVATGVGSASSIALHRLSSKNRSPLLSSGSQGNLRRVRSPAKKTVNQKLLRKLNSLNSAAPVVSYTELDDKDGGLSRHAKSRVQRMMHYDVSLRPFVATVKLQETFKKENTLSSDNPYGNHVDSTSGTSSPLEGPFMCTPQSFPPTPASRAHVLKRGSRFADDVVFLARDQLRVHDGLESSNERTREMAQALTQGKRLAVFDADDASAGIDLSCGQHVATKVGPLLYCSSRSMVPILRNCFVYFEMTVLGRSGGVLQTSLATLSFGLSTKEMPTDTLVGAWKGSVGLCTIGQILLSGQWCTLGQDPTIGPFGDRETVGCLVCLDDSSAFETWDGVMITATVTFNINGRIVTPHVPSLPISGLGQHPPTLSQPTIPQSTTPPSSTLPLLVPAEEELYPTLTLHSPGTSVMCRFSAGDVVARSRDAIGAPPKVPVYAVDGSLVFNGED